GLGRRVPEDRLGRVVPSADEAVLVDRDHRVERGLQHRAKPRLARADVLLGVASGDELADLTTEDGHRLEEPLVERPLLPREELHHADVAAWTAKGKGKGCLQPAATRGSGPRKVPVLGSVSEPRRLAQGEHPAGQPFPRLECERLTERPELTRLVTRMPGADTAEDPLLRIEFPHRAELPS